MPVEEETVPRAPWHRRLATDSPRPAGRGRRWTGRLRRGGGVFARQVLRVRHRRRGEPYPHRLSPQPRLDRPNTMTVAAVPPAAAVPPTAVARAATVPAVAADPAAAPVALLPGERTAVRRMWFVVVNACTLASLALGVLAILLAMRADVQNAALSLIACVVLDGLDGALARRLGVASPFGVQMDSLADMCAFGIAAPVVVYASLAGSVPVAAAAIACALLAGCAAIRLARFNISPKDSRFFTGVPTTMAAAVLAVAVLVDLPVPATAMLAGVALLAFAMVSSFPYATLARLFRLPPWVWLAPLAGALADPRLTFVALVAAYLASGPVLWLHHRRAAV